MCIVHGTARAAPPNPSTRMCKSLGSAEIDCSACVSHLSVHVQNIIQGALERGQARSIFWGVRGVGNLVLCHPIIKVSRRARIILRGQARPAHAVVEM